MANWWDRETTQLRRRIDELEKQNEKLRGMLSDAVAICDLALVQDKMRRKASEEWEQLSAPAALADESAGRRGPTHREAALVPFSERTLSEGVGSMSGKERPDDR
jgi:hypothetical protein